MAYKMGMLLSLLFLFSVMLFAGDLLCVSAIHSNLDAIALTAGRRISKEGRLSASIVYFVESEGAKIECLDTCSPAIGDTMRFCVYKDFSSLVMAKEPMRISVIRTVVVGYIETME